LLKKHLETVSKITWNTLSDAMELEVSQGEETITDNILLYLKRQHLKSLTVIKTPKNLESEKGTDWEWWIGNDSKGWLRYAVQAKKLDTPTKRYLKLNHDVGVPPNNERQDVVLQRYAKSNNAIPMYALYNFIKEPDYKPYWNCPLNLEIEQLGITVTPLHRVKEAIITYGSRSFEKIHAFPETIPIRCLAHCPKVKPDHKGYIKKLGVDAKIYSTNDVPFLSSQRQPHIEAFPPDLYSAEAGIYPIRILKMESE